MRHTPPNRPGPKLLMLQSTHCIVNTTKTTNIQGFDEDDVSFSEPIKEKLAKILDDWDDDSNTN